MLPCQIPDAPSAAGVVQHYSGRQVIHGQELERALMTFATIAICTQAALEHMAERVDKHDKLTDWIAKYHPDVLTSYEASEEVRRRIEESVSAPKP